MDHFWNQAFLRIHTHCLMLTSGHPLCALYFRLKTNDYSPHVQALQALAPGPLPSSRSQSACSHLLLWHSPGITLIVHRVHVSLGPQYKQLFSWAFLCPQDWPYPKRTQGTCISVSYLHRDTCIFIISRPSALQNFRFRRALRAKHLNCRRKHPVCVHKN